MTIQVLNGANLGRLGLREPDKYGTTTYAELVDLLEETGRGLGLEVSEDQMIAIAASLKRLKQ